MTFYWSPRDRFKRKTRQYAHFAFAFRRHPQHPFCRNRRPLRLPRRQLTEQPLQETIWHVHARLPRRIPQSRHRQLATKLYFLYHDHLPAVEDDGKTSELHNADIMNHQSENIPHRTANIPSPKRATTEFKQRTMSLALHLPHTVQDYRWTLQNISNSAKPNKPT